MRDLHRPRASMSSLEASVLTPTLPASSEVAYPSTTRDVTPPEACSRLTHLSMTLSERSILLAEDGPELVQKALHDEGGYRRIVLRPGEAYGELLGLHRHILPESDPQPMSRRRMIWTGIRAREPVKTSIQATSTSTPAEGPVASSLHTLTAW